MSLPKDPVMLLSVINTKLRDYYPSLEELAKAEGITEEEIINKLNTINYLYDKNRNQFVQRVLIESVIRKENNYANKL